MHRQKINTYLPVITTPIASAGLLYSGARMLLAQDLIANREAFSWQLKQPGAIYLDNGKAEGVDVTFKDLLELAKDIRPDVLVAPDELDDPIRTKREFKYAVEQGIFAYDWAVMAVIQSSLHNFQSALELIDFYSGYPVIIGIPYRLTKQIGIKRSELVQILLHTHPHTKVHLLGMDDIFDDIKAARSPNVISIDSALPVTAGANGSPLFLAVARGLHQYRKRQLPESPDKIDISCIYQNIRKMELWVHG